MRSRIIIILVLMFAVIFIKSQKINKDSIVISIKAFQDELNKEYSDTVNSPLLKEDLLSFKGLDFFPANLNFCVLAKLTRTPNEKSFKMPTTTSRTPEYIKYGELHFKINGKSCKLNVYQNVEFLSHPQYKNYLFLPFKDLTSGDESYGGGRFIDLTITESDVIILDFNKAYNPLCAYNHNYSCPIPPKENFLNIKILAGVKNPH